MSNYWAGYTGLAIMLEKEEITNFFKRYLSKTFYKDSDNIPVEKLQDLISEYSASEIGFVKSKYVNENPFTTLEESIVDVDFDRSNAEKLFTIMPWDNDQYDGALFIPMEKDERCGEDNCFTFRESDAILIWATKSIMPWEILNGNSYKSNDEIIDDFKDRLSAYLPDDFNWKTHIGFIEYAAYA